MAINYLEKYLKLRENFNASLASSSTPQEPLNEAQQEYLDTVRKNIDADNIRANNSDMSTAIYEAFLFEALYHTFDNSIAGHSHVAIQPLMRAMVKGYIAESGGVFSLLNKMKTKTLFLSEMNRIVNKYSKKVINETKLDGETEICIDDEVKKSFYDELNATEIEDVTTEIRNRVSDSMSQFITDNAAKKQEIQKIIDDNTKLKEGINKDDPYVNAEELAECYDNRANQKINALKNDNTVLSYFINGVAKSTIKNQALFNESSINGRLDMDKVIDKAGTMYTFLEMLNTTKLEDVNEEYLKKVINDL